MTSSFRLSQLNEAVRSEQSENMQRQQRCDSFLEKIILSQSGKADVPSENEFLCFREDLIRVAAVRALKAGRPS